MSKSAPPRTESDSDESIVEKGWSVITTNTEILAFMACGVVSTISEVLGYWPVMKTELLFGGVAEEEEQSDLSIFLAKVTEVIKITRYYSLHLYLATYILLPYPVITEKQKVLLTPWLLCAVFRSLLLGAVDSLVGLLVCSFHTKLQYPCIKYTVEHAVEFCISLYAWTTVHSFYHFLDRNRSGTDLDKVMKTIHKVGKRKGKLSKSSSLPSLVLSLNGEYLDDEDDDSMETTLVERAAMAWIAREILESGEEYVTYSQFNKYLAMKATIELSQIIKELAEKRREEKRKLNLQKSIDKRIKDSLEFCMKMPKREKPKKDPPENVTAFEQSDFLSKRDPIRGIIPLTLRGQPFMSDNLNSSAMNLNQTVGNEYIGKGNVDVQTDPLSPEMLDLFNKLEEREVTH